MTPQRDAVIDVLKKCRDAVLPINLWDLGLIYEIKAGEGSLEIVMTLRTAGDSGSSPVPGEVEKALKDAFPDCKIEVKVVFEPEWTPERMTQDGQNALGIQDA